MSEIQVTVLMPAYNTEAYIAEAIESVLQQTFTNFEFLIINDGSTDNTEQIIRSYNDPRIVLVNQKNGGVSNALNTGLSQARGKYIARFDADDICYPDRLQEQFDFMEKNTDYILIGSDVNYMDKNGEFLFFYSNIAHTPEDIVEKIRVYCPFIHSSVFYRTEVVKQLGGYDVRAHTFEDYYLWIKLIKAGKSCNFKKPAISVRLNPESVTVDERLRGKRFGFVKKEMLFGPPEAMDLYEQELLAILKSQNFHAFKQYTYYTLIAKKFLWNNYNPSKARKNAMTAIRLKPLSISNWGIWAMSFLPQKMILKIYQKAKS